MKFFGLTASALCVLMLYAAPVAAQQQQQPDVSARSVDLGLKEIPEAQIDAYVAKSNGVVGLLNASLRGSESWRRYLSWVDVKKGPTGKERIIYGLYSIGSSSKDAIEKARKSAAAEPAVPTLDGATKELAAAFDALVPILNEAEAYYDRKDYMADGMKGGRELHARLMPAASTFLIARMKTEQLQEQFKDLLDRQQLARIEKAEGKSVKWHTRNTMMLAKKAVDLMPRDPRKPGDLKAFDAALTEFGEAVRTFDTAVRESGKSGSVDSYPRDILGKLREMRANIGKGRVDPMTFSMDVDGVITRYNMMITMSNAFR